MNMKLNFGWRFATCLVGIGLFLTVGNAWCQATPSKAERQIRALLDQQTAAWNRGDLSAFMAGYWDSTQTTFTGSSGIQRGYDAVLDRYRHAYPDRAAMGQLTFSNLEIHMLSPDAAFVLGDWQLKRAHDSLGGVFTLILRRFPEGWRIIHDHTSSIIPPPGATASSH